VADDQIVIRQANPQLEHPLGALGAIRSQFFDHPHEKLTATSTLALSAPITICANEALETFEPKGGAIRR
jgi:hypothetical protein